MKKRRIIAVAVSLLLTGAVAVNLTGCTAQVQAADLMEGVSAAAVPGKAADDSFIRSDETVGRTVPVIRTGEQGQKCPHLAAVGPACSCHDR